MLSFKALSRRHIIRLYLDTVIRIIAYSLYTLNKSSISSKWNVRKIIWNIKKNKNFEILIFLVFAN